MRIALVSPYSWTFPGGVTRHVEALAGELLAAGHDVRVLTPVDRDTRAAAWLHAGARPLVRPLPPHVVPIGGTFGMAMNGAVSNLAMSPSAVARLRHELRTGGFDVVHVHSPDAAIVSWDAMLSARAPIVATFHAYAPGRASTLVMHAAGFGRRMNRAAVRIAVSEAAAWTAARWHGGATRIIPNGVHLPPAGPPAAGRRDGVLDVAFVGQAVERKGLPVLLRAFAALREHVPARLTLVGPGPRDLAALGADRDPDVVALGRVDDVAKARVLAQADVLCAPSLGGESFGMVLTEAFAHGTPVVASDIVGYREVVRDGREGVLVERGDPVALAAALRELALDPARRQALGRAGRERAERYAWPRIAAEVAGAYEDALAAPVPATALGRAAARHGLRPADGGPIALPRRLPSPDLRPGPDRPRRPGATWPAARRALLALVVVAAIAGAAAAVGHVGADRVAASLVDATPTWVLAALGVMAASMVLRALAWHAILCAALPGRRVRRADALQGTAIGVLMSATLPARLGEPCRALVVARRLGGRARETLPVVVGTLVSQTLLNVLALALLGAAVLSSLDVVRDHRQLVGVAVAPLAVVLAVLVAPIAPQAAAGRALRRALAQARDGLRVFRRPRLGLTAAALQLSAWALQALACWLLLVALGLDGRAGIGAAAGVLLAVNVTAVLPAVPSNLGVFQAACVAVLAAYGVGYADALAYGIILQAVEIATAVVMGVPALLREGLTWREARIRALGAAPVTLAPIGREQSVPSG